MKIAITEIISMLIKTDIIVLNELDLKRGFHVLGWITPNISISMGDFRQFPLITEDF